MGSLRNLIQKLASGPNHPAPRRRAINLGLVLSPNLFFALLITGGIFAVRALRGRLAHR